MTYSPVAFGPNSSGTSRSLATSYQNGSGSTLTMGTPVSINGIGQMVPVNITTDASVAGFLGLVAQDTPSGSYGLVIDAGRLENITTGFSIGDAIYIGVTPGTLTNVRPNIGSGSPAFSSGDYCIFVGVIVVNQFNPTNKDLKIYKEIVGQL